MSHRVKRFNSAVALVSGLLLAAGIAGCDRTQPTSKLLADAKQYQEKGDLKAAVIQLKNAAAQEPDNGAVRRELGMVAFESGDFDSADKELRKAVSLGVPQQELLPTLAKIQLARGKYKELLEELPATTARQSAVLLMHRADALAAMGQTDEAKSALDEAAKLEPKNADVLLSMARLAGAKGDMAAFNRYAEEAIQADPGNVNVWLVKAGLQRADGKIVEAIATYDKAVEVAPRNVEARIQRAFLYIDSGKFAEAKKDLDQAKATNPRNLMVNYMQAYNNFAQGKTKEAQEMVQKVLKAVPNHGPSLLLSGAIALRLNAPGQAEQDLRKFLEINPNHVYGRKLLAQALLNTAQPKDAVATLDPALKLAPQDPQLLALAGQSYMQSREFNKASDYLEKAVSAAPDVAVLRTSLGMAQLGRGEVDKGLAELKRATNLDPKATDAAFTLIQAELARKNYAGALAEVVKLEAQQPNNPQIHNVKGHVHLASGDEKAARTSFNKALSLQADFYPAVASLAFMDLRNKQPEAAKQRFQALLAKNKNDIRALGALAELAQLEGKSVETTNWLEKAYNVDQNAVVPALRLGNQYLRVSQFDQALNLARKLASIHPTNPDVLDLLGQAQMAKKDPDGALETYSKLANLLPKSGMVQMRLAGAHLALKNGSAAADDIKRAIELQPDLLQARTAAVELAVSNKRFNDALALARATQKDLPRIPLGYALEGDIYMFQKQGPAALAAYEKAFAVTQTPDLAIKLYEASKVSGKEAEGLRRLAAWQSSHPKELAVSHHLATVYLQKSEFASAIPLLEGLVTQAPQNAVALNNLAYAYSRTKDARALPTAEKAVKLAGENPAVLDTLGWILVEQGNHQRGLPLLQKAAEGAPGSPEIAYHLAVALHKSGKRDAARIELDKLLAKNQTFPELEEARALRKAM